MDPLTLLGLILLSTVNRMINGVKIKEVVKLFNVKLSAAEWIGCSAIINLYNYFMSKSGTAMVSVYLKKAHGLNYSRFISLLVGDVVVAFLSSGLAGFACSLYAYKIGVFENLMMPVFFLALTLATLVLLLLPEMAIPGTNKVSESLNKLLHGWNILRKDLGMVSVLFALNTAIMLIFAWRYFIIFRMFSTSVPFYVCLIISPLSVIVQFTSIIPGAYGLREAVAGYATKLSRLGFASGALATLVDRVIMMFVSFVMGIAASYMLFGKVPGLREEVQNEKV